MIERRLRIIQLSISVFGFIGLIVELLLKQHWGQPWQILPFVLCGLAIVVILAFLVRDDYAIFLVLRLVMILVVLGAIIGIIQHLQTNFLSLNRLGMGSVTSFESMSDMLRGYAPVLAPGGMIIGAVLSFSATYRYPLAGRHQRQRYSRTAKVKDV